MTQNPYCIRCGSVLARIAYGFPSPDLFDNPNFVLGGCLMEDNQPEYFCKKCDVAVSNQEASEAFFSVGYACYSESEKRVLHVIKFTSSPMFQFSSHLSPGDFEWSSIESQDELDEYLEEFNSSGSQVWQIGVDDMWDDNETPGQEAHSSAAILSVWGDLEFTRDQLEQCGSQIEAPLTQPAWFEFNS